jgi:drug/metabolite transporter superfamily protein YnfA
MSDTTPPPPPAAAPTATGPGPVGTVRSPLIVLLLTIVTFGIYGLIWIYGVFKELKAHTGEGLGGPIALLLAFFTGLSVFFLPHEIGNMYAKSGQEKPMTWLAGFWNFLPIIGSIIWLWKVQNAMNARWTAAAAA